MPQIPNQFHFIFGLEKQCEPFHVLHYICLESCRQVNKPSAIYFYYHYEPYGPYWDAIKPFLILEKVPLNSMVEKFQYVDPAQKPFRYAHHSDFIRLEKLIERGGVYADMDTLFVRPLRKDLFQFSFVMGREDSVWDSKKQQSAGSLCNALMLSAPDSGFGRLWLERMYGEFDGSWSNHSTQFPHRLAMEVPDLIHVEPQRSFFHFAATSDGLSKLFEDCVPIPQDVYSIHLWAHLWWDEHRTDFVDFHAGLLTRRLIQERRTTYNMAARSFLPPANIATPQSERPGLAKRVQNFAKGYEQGFRSAVGRVVYPLVVRYKPDAAQKLGFARGYVAYRKALLQFSGLSRHEASIARNVLQWDEYGIFSQSLRADDVVIDIGGHIGSFAFACHWLGSRNIHTFEAAPSNFTALRRNVGGLSGVHAHERAVFRSDNQAPASLLHSGPIFANTGGGSVMFGRRFFEHVGIPSLDVQQELASASVVALDDVLAPFEHVRILKLDCEGSEYPILLTSGQLHKVERIVGEYHVIPEESMPLLVPQARIEGHASYGPETIRDLLEAQGFDVRVQLTGQNGIFDAVRKALPVGGAALRAG